jgi:hypothetical protein
MSDKHKSTTPSAIQVKNEWKVISTEEKLGVSWLEKCEWNVDICHSVRLTHSSICKIYDNSDRIKGSAKSGTKVFV